MSLLKEWHDLMEGQTKSTINAFWEEYAETESKIYSHILSHKDEKLSGKVSELVERFQCDKTIFMGFLDGINSSLNQELDLNKITLESELTLDIDFEKLYFNMHKADADYLYNLDEWNDVLTEDKRVEIANEYRRSRTVRVGKKIGRNEPCPCGSGKKYKQCCLKKQ